LQYIDGYRGYTRGVKAGNIYGNNFLQSSVLGVNRVNNEKAT